MRISIRLGKTDYLPRDFEVYPNLNDAVCADGWDRQAVLNAPQLLIVDEPTVGLDHEERVRFRNLLSDLSGECIVILSRHNHNIMLRHDFIAVS